MKRLSALAALLALPALLSTAHAADGSAALKMLSKDTGAVVVANVERLRGSAIFKDFLQMAGSSPDGKEGMAKLKDDFGIDPEKNVQTLIIGVPGNPDREEPVVFVQGSFDEKKVVAGAQKNGAKTKEEKHEGVTVYTVEGEKGGIYFHDGYLVAGPAGSLKKAIGVTKGKDAAVGKNGPLNTQIDKADKSKDLWFAVALTPDMKKNMGKDPETQSLQGIRGSVDLAKGLGVDLSIVTGDKDAAAKLAKKVQEELGQAKSNPGMAAMGLGDALANAKVQADGADLKISVQLSEAEVGKIKSMLGMAMMMKNAGGKPPVQPAAPGSK